MATKKWNKGVKKKAAKKAAKKATKRAFKRAVKRATKKAAKRAAPRKKPNFTAIRRRRLIMMQPSSINSAEFVKDNILSLTFNNGVKKDVDFSPFLNSINIPYLRKYKTEKYFRNFKLKNGNVAWGRDWDLIFPISELYKGKIS